MVHWLNYFFPGSILEESDSVGLENSPGDCMAQPGLGTIDLGLSSFSML